MKLVLPQHERLRSIMRHKGVGVERSEEQALARLPSFFSHGTAAAAFLVGLAILGGWYIDDNELKSLFRQSGAAINPLVAIELLLAGAGLALLNSAQKSPWRKVGAACGVLMALIALCKIVGNELMWFRSVDTWIFYFKLGPNRMDPNTAMAFFLLGLALATLDLGRRHRRSQLLIVSLLALGVLSQSSSLNSIAMLYWGGWYLPIVSDAALCYVALCLGLLAARPHREPVATLRDSTAGGSLARRLLPFAIIVPLALDWLRTEGEAFYGDEFGLSLFALICVLIFNVLLWSQAHLMGNIDRQRQRGEAEIKRSEERFRLLFEGSHDAIYVCDVQGCFVDANQRGEELLGCRRQELLTRRFADFIDLSERRRVFATVRRVLEGESVSFESFFLRGDGTRIVVETSASLVDAERGLIQGISRDVSERKEADRKLHESQAEAEAARSAAEAANHAKGEFLANMSHEIRTPMNAIIGFSDLLDMTALDAQQRDYVQTVRTSSQALLGLINDILDFSKVEAGKLEIESVPFSLRDVVEGVADMFREKTAIKDVELIVAIDMGIPDALLGDPLRLRQVLINLTGNAVKFTEVGQVLIEVKGGEQVEGFVAVEFAVRDTGPGIEAEKLEGLFKAFVQADASTTRKHGGTGLGLSISKGIVELMGGAVRAESKLGSGSRFSFTSLFVIQTQQRDWQPVLPTPLCDLSVLVVDDNRDNAEVAKHMLKLFGLDCESAAAGPEALEKLSHRRFDLVLMDYFMPGMDGLQVSRLMRADEDLSTIPIIMMTAFGKERERRRAEEIGIDAFLIKPVKMSLLFDSIVEVCSPGERQVSSEPAADASSPLFKGQRVLLVEDNAVNQKLAKILLERAGLAVEVAENGLLALDAIGKESFSLVLMDLQMPVMGGIEATQAIRRLPEGGDVPIIAMTAEVMQGDREKCLAAGMDSYVQKPISPEVLFAELGKRLEVGRSEDGVNGAPSNLSESFNCESVREKLAGIDVDNVLARVLGDWDVVAELAADFVADFAGFETRIVAAIETSDLQTAQRLFHTLKGAAGNMGADALSEWARAGEAALREGRVEETGALLVSLAAELRTVCISLRSLVRAEPLAPAVDRAVDNNDVENYPPELVANLGQAVDDADPVEARACLDALRAAGKMGDDETLKKLVRAIGDFDFDLARILLKEVSDQSATEGLAAVKS